MTATLEKILAEVKTLSPAEKTELKEILSAQEISVEAQRQALIRETMGKYAHLPGSVDEFLANKHEDNEREERRRGW